MYWVMLTGVSLWGIYGILIEPSYYIGQCDYPYSIGHDNYFKLKHK